MYPLFAIQLYLSEFRSRYSPDRSEKSVWDSSYDSYSKTIVKRTIAIWPWATAVPRKNFALRMLPENWRFSIFESRPAVNEFRNDRVGITDLVS